MEFRIISRTYDTAQSSAMVELRALDEHGNQVIVVARFTFTPGADQNHDQMDPQIERKARRP